METSDQLSSKDIETVSTKIDQLVSQNPSNLDLSSSKINIHLVEFLPLIHKFFSDVKTFQEGTSFLKKHMNEKIFDYPLFETRKIFYSLIVYKFGKELEYPELLQTSARQLILFVLQNRVTNDLTDKTLIEKRKKIFKEFLQEFEKYKKEDFKNYMYELAIQYNQLVELRINLAQEPEWLESIEKLQDKVLDQVTFSKGEVLFEECLEKLGKVKLQIIKEQLVNAYWDIMLNELEHKCYKIMMENYTVMKNLLLEMREDEDTKEILDEKYILQLLENDLFTEDTLIGQVDFIFHKMKKYGVPIYDKMLEKTRDGLIKDIREKGICPEIVVFVLKKIFPILDSYIEIIRIYRNRIKEIKTKETGASEQSAQKSEEPNPNKDLPFH
jgi:hypothetical protein